MYYLSSSQRWSIWCKQVSSTGRPMKMLVLISDTAWRSAALSLSRMSLEMQYYFAFFHYHSWGKQSSGSTRTRRRILCGHYVQPISWQSSSHWQDQCSLSEDIELLATTWWDSPKSFGALSRFHTWVSSSWDGELASHVDILSWAQQQHS